jgi:hypothetical protein
MNRIAPYRQLGVVGKFEEAEGKHPSREKRKYILKTK